MARETLAVMLGGVAAWFLGACTALTDLDGLSREAAGASAASTSASSATGGERAASSATSGTGAGGGAGPGGASTSSAGGAGGTGGARCPDVDPLDLVGYWTLDDGLGLMASDASGNQNAAALLNGATWSPTGAIGGAVELDGTDDLLQVPPNASLDFDSDFTLAAWFRADSFSTVAPGRNPRIFQKGTTAASAAYGLSFETAMPPTIAHVSVRILGTPYSVDGGTAIQTGTWHHVAGVREGSLVRLYLDGKEDGSGSFPAGFGDLVDEPLAIGESPGNSDGAFDGGLDDLRIYRRGLSQSEVAALVCAGRGN